MKFLKFSIIFVFLTIICNLSSVLCFSSTGTWTQTSVTDWNSGNGVNIDTTTTSGSVAIGAIDWGSWVEKNYTGQASRRVAISADGTIQAAAYLSGNIYVSIDTGTTWSSKAIYAQWYDIDMSSNGTKQTAVVMDGKIYVSVDSGNTWTAKENNRNWSAVAVSADGNKQIAGAYNGNVYVSTDTGNTWVEKVISCACTSMSMSDDGTKQTVVGSGQIFLSTDTGNTWSSKKSSLGNVWDVDMSADGTIQTAVVYNGQIYVSTDTGNTWIAKDTNRQWWGVAMSSDGTKQTATAGFNSSDYIYVSTDTGDTWFAKESLRRWQGVAMSADGTKQIAGTDLGGSIYVNRAINWKYNASFSSKISTETSVNWDSWGTFSVNDYVPTGSTITYFVKTSTAQNNFAVRPLIPVSNGGTINSVVGPYIQVISSFSRTDLSVYPRVDDFSVSWNYVYPQISWEGWNSCAISSYTAVEYRVKYTDADPPATGYPKINILRDSTTIQTLCANWVSGENATGAIYSSSTLLSPCSYYTYTVETIDYWNFNSTYTLTGIGPDVGYKISGFVIAPDNTRISSATVKIVGISTRTYVSESNGYYELIGTVNNNWVVIISTSLVNPAIGNISFTPSNYPFTNLSGEQSGVNFTRDNNTPVLNWLGGVSDYVTDGLDPEIGASTTTLTFQIKYKDSNNDAPLVGYPKVVINKNGSFYRSFAMNYSATDFTTDVVCSTTVTLAPSYQYTYSIQAYDKWSANASALTGPSAPNPDIRAYLSGRVVLPNGVPMNNIKMTLNGTTTKYTDTNGEFFYNMLATGVNYSLVPESSTVCQFDCPVLNLSPLSDNTTQQFTRINRSSITWTGDTNYLTDGLDIEQDLVGGTIFTYRCKYIDLDGDAPTPGYPMVRILKGGTTVYDVSMTEVDVSVNYAAGKKYYYSTTLPSGLDYSYYFVSRDTFSLESRTPTLTGPIVSISSPTLSYLGTTGYENDGVNPDVALLGTTYYFFVLYKDADNDQPASGYPLIKIKKNSTEIVGSPFAMQPSNSGYSNFIAGATYYYSICFSSSGTYEYQFEALDQYSKQAVLIYKSGPKINTIGAFSFEGSSGYTTDFVEPNAGMTSDVFTFKVKYTDAENDAAITGYPKLIIKKNSIFVSSTTMSFVSGASASAGLIYSCTAQLLLASTNYAYNFIAYDSDNYLSQSAEFLGPILNLPPQLSWVGTTGYETSAIDTPIISQGTTAYYFIKYSDPESNAPASGYPKLRIFLNSQEISGSPFAMNYVSGNNSTGALYGYSKLLSTGSYTYSIEPCDNLGGVGTTVTGSGPEVGYKINGYIFASDGTTAISGAIVYIVNGTTRTTTTDSNGYYELTATSNQNWVLSVQFSSATKNFYFYPESVAYNSINSNKTQNFTRVSRNFVLSFTGAAGYVSDAVEPDFGTIESTYTFFVKYQDDNGIKPKDGYPKLNIYNQGQKIMGSPFIMTIKEGSDYSLGVTYGYNVSLSTGIGYSYIIECYDNLGVSSAAITGRGPKVFSKISGYVKNPKAVAMPNIEVKLLGETTSQTYATQTNGYFEFLVSTETFTVSISSPSYFAFSPASYTLTNTQFSSTDILFNRLSKSPIVECKTVPCKAASGTPKGPNDLVIFQLFYKDADRDVVKQGYPCVHILNNGTTIQTLGMSYTSGDCDTGITYSTATYIKTLGVYSYSINAIDEFDTAISSIIIGNFDICYNEAPITPSNNSTKAKENAVVTSGKVSLAWQPSTSLNGIITYTLYLSISYDAALAPARFASAITLNEVYKGTNPNYDATSLQNGKTYYWQVKAEDPFGVSSLSPLYNFATVSGAILAKARSYPTVFNPAIGQTTNIAFSMAESGSVEISIYSELGDLCWKRSFDGLSAGTNEITYDGKDGSGQLMYNGSYVCIIMKKYLGRSEKDFCRILVVK